MNQWHAGWAVKIWVVATVFVLPFLTPWEVAGWVALGAILGLVWKVVPEAPPEKPVAPLPYADKYRDKEIPRR
ncbi:MAG TPA: hypothetical protein VFN74_02415 [Chloroflexota bacterium]|nr:hypothetical protein [Chloroflexota bacterium]